MSDKDLPDNRLNLLRPCQGRPKGWWSDEEADIVDVLLHLLRPDLVVESGTQHGDSAIAFLHHAKRVITIDPSPKVPRHQFSGKPIIQIVGSSPEDLDAKVSPLIERDERWLFFHDSRHTARVLVGEASWAVRNGAIAILWHDAGKREGHWEKEGTMPDGLAILKAQGYEALRLSDSGNPGVSEEEWTGIGFAWGLQKCPARITRPERAERGPAPHFEILVGERFGIRVPADFDEEAFCRLLRLLESAC